jgi:hypothetical protein
MSRRWVASRGPASPRFKKHQTANEHPNRSKVAVYAARQRHLNRTEAKTLAQIAKEMIVEPALFQVVDGTRSPERLAGVVAAC